MVWGHSLVWLMVHTFTQAFPFAFHLYDKKVETSKMDLAIEMLSLLKGKRARPMYVLMDSWYPSKELIEACLKQGFHVIAMLKTNRILDPKGIAIKPSRWPAISSLKPPPRHGGSGALPRVSL